MPAVLHTVKEQGGKAKVWRKQSCGSQGWVRIVCVSACVSACVCACSAFSSLEGKVLG